MYWFNFRYTVYGIEGNTFCPSAFVTFGAFPHLKSIPRCLLPMRKRIMQNYTISAVAFIDGSYCQTFFVKWNISPSAVHLVLQRNWLLTPVVSLVIGLGGGGSKGFGEYALVFL